MVGGLKPPPDPPDYTSGAGEVPRDPTAVHMIRQQLILDRPQMNPGLTPDGPWIDPRWTLDQPRMDHGSTLDRPWINPKWTLDQPQF